VTPIFELVWEETAVLTEDTTVHRCDLMSFQHTDHVDHTRQTYQNRTHVYSQTPNK